MKTNTQQYQSGFMGQYLSYVDISAAYFVWSAACCAGFLAVNILILFFTIDYDYSPILCLIILGLGFAFAWVTGNVRAYKSMRAPKFLNMLGWLVFVFFSSLFPLFNLCGYFTACVINRRFDFRLVRPFLELVLIPYLIIAILICDRFFIEARYIPSIAMSPTLQIGDRLVTENVSSLKGAPVKRGQIVIFEPPNHESDLKSESAFAVTMGNLTGLPRFPGKVAYIKRVIGLPGEAIEIRAGDGVYINGSKLDESSYLKDVGSYNLKVLGDIGGRSMTGELIHPYPKSDAIIVPPNMVFLLGDNRDNSEDSHVFGFVDQHKIIGRAWVMFRPIYAYMHDANWHRPAK